MVDPNLFTAFYLHDFTVMHNYFYGTVLNAGDGAKYLPPNPYRDASRCIA